MRGLFTTQRMGLIMALALGVAAMAQTGDQKNFSGIYPHLAFFNNENECGTGAVVPWAGKLWAVTYAPHAPRGSSDKLYSIAPDLTMTIHEESIGGTPANRMIHRESNQLFIGPYAVDAKGAVRVISYEDMPGRPTGNARHLTDPEGKIYYATMEEGIYEVDVKTLAVTTLFTDTHVKDGVRYMSAPGYHGKGLYSGFDRLLYANNGEHGQAALTNPLTESGALAQWFDQDEWEIVLREQFTEITGPGGIYGAANPDSDPIWAVGWDHRSVMLMLLDDGKWTKFRLPKASHSYDGAHGWNTEWPRVREIGDDQDAFLMTMHGTFWKFPSTFQLGRTGGIAPRSNYLKVIGDFTRWGDYVVMGCDDTAKAEFLNKRKAKGEIAAPQSQSNLWFVKPDQLDHIGPAIGRGAVWLNDDAREGEVSDPFLINGYDKRGLHLSNGNSGEARFAIELDVNGHGQWKQASTITVEGRAHAWVELRDDAQWARVRALNDAQGAIAWFSLANNDTRSTTADPMFDGLARPGESCSGGIVRARAENERTLHYAALQSGEEGATNAGYYILDENINLKRVDDASAHQWLRANAKIPVGFLSADDASAIYTDDDGKRWRLPKGSADWDLSGPLGAERGAREVATERDLFNAFGIFYELPARNAGGFKYVRPVSTHNRRIKDFCSYRGLFIMSGVRDDAPTDNPHIARADDGKTALWVGAIDDVWKMGKPVGVGGPWKSTAVAAGEASEPYLMTGFDQKTLTLRADSIDGAGPVQVTVEIDISGDNVWRPYKTFELQPGAAQTHTFPDAFNAYWLRCRASVAGRLTAQLVYE